MAKRVNINDVVSRYGFTVWYSEEDGAYIARCIETGTLTHGKTAEKAIKEGQQAAALYVEDLLARKQSMPEPLSTMEYSGKLVVRMSKELHREAAMNAAIQGVSLNQYIVSKL